MPLASGSIAQRQRNDTQQAQTNNLDKCCLVPCAGGPTGIPGGGASQRAQMLRAMPQGAISSTRAILET
eukprot:7301317-Pyramimonas_sp.AAC.2